MVSDSELIARLREVLQTSDLNTTTTAIVRRKLEEDFEIDLSDKKSFIREQVNLFLQTQLEKQKADGEEDQEEDQEEEEEEDAEEDEKPRVKSEPKDGFCSGDESEDEEEEDEEEEEEEEEESDKKNEVVKKRGGGFTQLCSLSPELQNVLGVPELARTDVVKQLWVYIRANNLQSPKNRKNIVCDEALRALFRVDTIDMFKMNKVLPKHIWPLERDGAPSKTTQKEKQQKQERREAPVKSTQKEKQRKRGRREGMDESKPTEKRQKGGGFCAPLRLSDALIKFFGTGESSMARGDVVKKMWEYFKQNDLQDPSDKKRILCDDKLKELFEVDSFHGFTVVKLLSAHFIKSEQ